MKEKIHDLKTALEVLRIQQTVSFDDCQKLMMDVHDKTGFTPPNFEISGNQWCVLVNLAVARFGNTTPPQRKPLTGEVVVIAAQSCLSPQQYDHFEALLENDQDAHNRLARAIEVAHGIKE